MNATETNIHIKDVKFVESGVLADRKKNGKIKLLSHIHILGYKKDKKSPLSLVCIEYGIFAEGKDRQSAIKNLVALVKIFLTENDKDIIDDFLEHDTETTRYFWTLYRKYEKERINKISIDVSKIEKKSTHKETVENLQTRCKKYEEEKIITDKMLNLLIQENVKLKASLKTLGHDDITANAFFVEDTSYPTLEKGMSYA